MIFPLWTGGSAGFFGLWPLIMLIAANCAAYLWVIHLAAANQEMLLVVYRLVGTPDWTVWRLLGASFFHVSMTHLLVNMWFLIMFGVPIVSGMRPIFFFALYFLTAAAGFALDNLFNAQGSVGSSSAVAGLMGFFLVHFFRDKVLCLFLVFLVEIPGWLLVLVFMSIDISGVIDGSDSKVAHWAHLGSMAAGILAGCVVLQSDRRKLARIASVQRGRY